MDSDSSAAAGIESPEELREALFVLRHEHEQLAQSSLQAQMLLDALESLLAVQIQDDPFTRVFGSLRKVFRFSSALMLAERDLGAEGAAQRPLECIVAEPAPLLGSLWPVGPLFRKVMDGKVVATFSNAGAEEWQHVVHGAPASECIARLRAQSALHVPVRTRERRGILLLLRGVDTGGFERSDVALARRFAVLVSHALAARFASQTEAEGRRLRELTAQLRLSEQTTRRNAELLQALVNVLPVGVAVQDADGKLLLANDAITTSLKRRTDDRRDTLLPADLRTDLDAAGVRRLEAFRAHLSSGQLRSREYTVTLEGREHTLLVTGKPVRIFEESLLVSTMLDITERKQLEQDLSRRAFHDALTGLPNRTRMQEIVGLALRRHASGGMFALAFIDLDNFKQINDYYSHAIGDALLKAVTQRVTQSLRRGDVLARISGDEFLLLVDPLTQEADLPPVIDRMVEALKQPFVIEGHELLTSASVGASIYPHHGDSYEALCRSADGAMYRAKRDRKGSASYFDHSMGNALTARMETEQRLRLAIRERRFRVAFQPKLRLADGQVAGLEALVRWVDEDGTVHMPGSFIELASELGLLDDITGFVVEKVATHLPVLDERFGDQVSVSINVSARQAGDAAFMDRLAERLEALGIAHRVVVELTEEALLATQRFVETSLPRLREAGVRLSIDDFGTGYSSLATLADLTVDEVKVDRSLITAIQERPRSQGILRAIESLCSVLDIELVAEGVETAAELAYLRDHTSIVMAQGYYFARPQFIEALVAPVFSSA